MKMIISKLKWLCYLAICVMVLLTGMQSDLTAKDKEIIFSSLRKASHMEAVENSLMYEFGYTSWSLISVEIQDAFSGTLLLTSKIVKRLGLEVDTAAWIYYNTDAVVSDLQNGDLDIITVFPEEYLEIIQKAKLDPFVVTAADGNYFDEYVLVVHKDMDLESVDDLSLKRIVIYNGLEGVLPETWLNVLLAKKGFPSVNEFFQKVKRTNKPSSTVLPVFFKQADVCLVPIRLFGMLNELNPQLGQHCVIITKSPKYMNGLICIRSSLGEAKQRSLLEESILTLNTEPEGQQILKFFRQESLLKFKPEYMATIIELMDEFERYYPNKNMKMLLETNE